MAAWSTWTSGGARAGAATNSWRAVSSSAIEAVQSATGAYQALVANELPREPQERLLEVVVGLGGDVVVLEILLAVEGDGLGLDLALLDIDLVAGQDNGDVLADTDQVTVPVGDVLVGDARGDVEHDDTALAVDVVAVAKTTELLLSSGVPDIELNLTKVLGCVLVTGGARFVRWAEGGYAYGRETKRVDLDTESSDVLLLELTSQVTLDEGGLR
jgi:hypothetical protein